MGNEEQRPQPDRQPEAQDFDSDLQAGDGLDGHDGSTTVLVDTSPGFDELLTYLREARGFDFGGYKRAGLARRIGKRLHAVKLSSYLEYVDYLQVHPNEFSNLFNSILINATSFFRDPTAWEYVQNQVVPRLLRTKKDNAPIRVWCAGCATGQEAYTVAMALADEIGVDVCSRRVKIYATDIDDAALDQARQAMYTAKEIASIPAPQLQAYFERGAARYTFNKDLRRSVIFGRHNLFYDAPISKIDLLLCRNTLMYFNADAQARILTSLHFALNPTGVLFLGKAEMLLTHSALFTPLDLQRRLFTKVTHTYPRSRAAMNSAINRVDEPSRSQSDQMQLVASAFDVSPIAQLVIDPEDVLVSVNEPARRLLGLSTADVGRSFQDTLVPRKFDGLTRSVQQASLERRVIHLPAAEWARANETSIFFDLVVSPVVDGEASLLGVQVSLLDVTVPRRMQDELQQSSQELEAAYEELQSTSEELETTNEELQSTVEELETTNEELQSTNEELETTNEELQSTNEELQGMNEELRVRTGDLGRLNLYFESILASIRSAVVVLDLEMHVQVWSDRAQDLWGLRADEVRGKHFLNFDIGLPVEQLSQIIRACISGDRTYCETTLAARNRRGKPIQCAIKLSGLTHEDQLHGVIMLMDEEEPSQV